MKLNRAARREFNRLPEEEKLKIVKAAVDDKVNASISSTVINAFADGVAYKGHEFYLKYVEGIDNAEGDEADDLVQGLLSEIRECHLKYVMAHGLEGAGNGKEGDADDAGQQA